MADNSPVVAVEPAAAPEAPSLESLIAEFERGTFTADAHKVADLIRQRDNPEPAPSAVPETAPEPAVEEQPAEPEIFPTYAPDWLSPERIQAQIAETKQRENDELVAETLDKLKADGVPEQRVREKLAAILNTEKGSAAFEKRGKAWQSVVQQARADIEAEVDAVAQKRVTALGNDISAARAAVANSSLEPIPERPLSNYDAEHMTDRQWSEYLAEQSRKAQRRR